MWTANEIASEDCVQLGGGQWALLVRDVQLLTKISFNPRCKWAHELDSHSVAGVGKSPMAAWTSSRRTG
jgi:hypothetical protein